MLRACEKIVSVFEMFSKCFRNIFIAVFTLEKKTLSMQCFTRVRKLLVFSNVEKNSWDPFSFSFFCCFFVVVVLGLTWAVQLLYSEYDALSTRMKCYKFIHTYLHIPHTYLPPTLDHSLLPLSLSRKDASLGPTSQSLLGWFLSASKHHTLFTLYIDTRGKYKCGLDTQKVAPAINNLARSCSFFLVVKVHLLPAPGEIDTPKQCPSFLLSHARLDVFWRQKTHQERHSSIKYEQRKDLVAWDALFSPCKQVKDQLGCAIIHHNQPY